MQYLSQYEICLIFLMFGIFAIGFSISVEDLHILKILKVKKVIIKYQGRSSKISFRRLKKAFDNSIIGKKGSVLPMVTIRRGD